MRPRLASPLRAAARAVRDFPASLSATGLTVASAASWASSRPTLAPRTWQTQSVVTGVSMMVGYWAGTRGSQVAQWALPRLTPAEATRSVVRNLAVAGLVATTAGALVTGHRFERQRAALWGRNHDGAHLLTALPLSLAAFTTPLLIQRGARRRIRALDTTLERWISHPVAAVAGEVIYLAGCALALRAGINEVLGKVITGMYATISGTKMPPGEPPTAPERSGSPASLVSWEQVGYEGRRFVSGGPSADEIAAVTGRMARDPIRVYAALPVQGRSVLAADLHELAQTLLAELDRTGAWDRRVLAVVTPTGTGWVDGCASAALEYLNDGDTAIAAMQYSVDPSWVQLVLNLAEPERAGRVLFEAVHERWAALPPDRRPLLMLFGLSLGAYGSQGPFRGLEDLRGRVDGAVWAGSPRFTPLAGALTAQRDAGSTQVHPVLDGGRHVRWATRNHGDQGLAALGPGESPRVVYLQHPSDGVVRWWWPAAWRREDWYREQPGQDVLPGIRWWPAVTGIQLFADMMNSDSGVIPAGYGHHYAGEYVDAWHWATQAPGWDEESLARLREVIAAVPR